MTYDIREAPEKVQVLYDALCEAFGEPNGINYGWLWTKFYSPAICLSDNCWSVWTYSEGLLQWLSVDKIDISECVEGWRAGMSPAQRQEDDYPIVRDVIRRLD